MSRLAALLLVAALAPAAACSGSDDKREAEPETATGEAPGAPPAKPGEPPAEPTFSRLDGITTASELGEFGNEGLGRRLGEAPTSSSRTCSTPSTSLPGRPRSTRSGSS